MCGKLKKNVQQSETLNLFQNNHVLFVFTFLWIKLFCLLILFFLNQYFSRCSWSEVCMVFCIPFPSHFLIISGHLFQTPDNSNFFLFLYSWKVQVIGSQLYYYIYIQVIKIPLSRGLTVLMILSSAILRFSKGLGLWGPKFLLCVFVH